MNRKEISHCEKIARSVTNSLHELRESAGISKSELSQKSGLSRSTIMRIENGDRQPTLISLIRIANAMQIDLWKVLKESDINK